MNFSASWNCSGMGPDARDRGARAGPVVSPTTTAPSLRLGVIVLGLVPVRFATRPPRLGGLDPDPGGVGCSADMCYRQAVSKRGCTTGLTSGVVIAVEASAGVPTRILTATFPFGGLFCDHGDSGSALLDGDVEVVGLLLELDEVAVDASGATLGSIGRSVPIAHVLDALQVEVAVSPPISQRGPGRRTRRARQRWHYSADGLGLDGETSVTFGVVPTLSARRTRRPARVDPQGGAAQPQRRSSGK
jgi:hypothetical protein